MSSGRQLARTFNSEGLRRLARSRLPRPIFDYLDGGSDDERTLRRNVDAFTDYELIPDDLNDVSKIQTATTLFGRQVAMPLMLSPTGLTRMFHPLAEPAVARQAERHGVLYALSTMGTTRIEELAGISAGPKVFQIYLFRDRGLTEEFIARCAQSIKIRPADRAGRRPESKRLDDVAATTNAAITDDVRARTHGRPDGGDLVHGRRRSVELPAAMVGDDQAGCTMVDRPFGVGRIQHPLDGDGPAPLARQPLEIAPGDGAVELMADIIEQAHWATRERVDPVADVGQIEFPAGQGRQRPTRVKRKRHEGIDRQLWRQ